MNIKELKNSIAFKGMDENDIEKCIKSLNTKEKEYKKGELILSAGDITSLFGLVLSGSVTIESNDIWGNKTILSHVGKLNFFAETYAILENEPMLVDVCANENCKVLFFDISNLKHTNEIYEKWAIKFIRNLLCVSANKNTVLSGRSFHISPRTIRERILSYLNTVSIKKNSKDFSIPFDRQQLADYLNVDRSALSHELGKLQKEGIIKFKKNHFVLNTF